MATKIDQLFDQVYRIPQVPEVVRVLIQQMNDPNIDMEAIAKNVEKEQVIALKVLRIVNSAYFGLSRQLSSISEAVVLLGMGQLKTLVIASGMVASVPDIKNFDVKSFWSNSFRTAAYSKWLANKIGLDEDLVFTAGLVSGLGTVLIYLGAPREANEIDQHVLAGNTRYVIEQKRLGYTSQDVCGELCRRWKFPEDLINTIAQSATPLRFKELSQTSCVVHIARYLSECKGLALKEEDMMRTFPYLVLEAMDINEQLIREHLPEILAIDSGLDGLTA
jgi:HD-like signal output (HDOD) protein